MSLTTRNPWKSPALSPLPLGTNGIQFINEDDGWSLLLGQGKSITDQFGTISNKHLHQLRACQLQEGSLRERGGQISPRAQEAPRIFKPISYNSTPTHFLLTARCTHLGLGGTGSGKQSLPCTRRPVHQHSFWGLDTQVLKLLFVVHRQDNGLYQLPGRSPG